jgi:excisionase family DNA binding protein
MAPKNAKPEPRLLRVAEVAERLDQHPSTIYRKLERGELPGLQLGGRKAGIRIDEAELEAWLRPRGRRAGRGQAIDA